MICHIYELQTLRSSTSDKCGDAHGSLGFCNLAATGARFFSCSAGALSFRRFLALPSLLLPVPCDAGCAFTADVSLTGTACGTVCAGGGVASIDLGGPAVGSQVAPPAAEAAVARSAMASSGCLTESAPLCLTTFRGCASASASSASDSDPLSAQLVFCCWEAPRCALSLKDLFASPAAPAACCVTLSACAASLRTRRCRSSAVSGLAVRLLAAACSCTPQRDLLGSA